jgi:hypothetical protein
MKEKLYGFKGDPFYGEKLDKLGKVLSLDRSKSMRLAIDEAFAKYVSPGHQGELFVADSATFDKSIKALTDEIFELRKTLKDVKEISILYEESLEEKSPGTPSKLKRGWEHHQKCIEIAKRDGIEAGMEYHLKHKGDV